MGSNSKKVLLRKQNPSKKEDRQIVEGKNLVRGLIWPFYVNVPREKLFKSEFRRIKYWLKNAEIAKIAQKWQIRGLF